MHDCELLNHPNVNGEGCPCGKIKRTLRAPLPYPIPLAVSGARMIRQLVDEGDRRRVASWHATTAARRVS